MNDQELLRKFSNKNWRMNNLYKIVDKESNLVTFKPNPIQQKINESNHARNNVLKARQFGVTTNGAIKLLDETIWRPNYTTCILAHKREILDKIFNIVKIAYKNLPEEIRPIIDKGGGSKYEIRFPEINSKIYTTLEVRGGTIHELHVSEAAFIPDERIKATLQAVPLGSPVTLETTPNGLNHYFDKWNQEDSEYNNLFFPWFMHPEYRIKTGKFDLTEEEIDLVNNAKANYGITLTFEQIAFRRHKISEYSGRLSEFLKEYPEDDQSCFLASGNNPFDALQIQSKIGEIPKTHKKVGEILVHEPFIKNRTYIIGADPAEGVKKDYSVAVCLCVDTMDTVAMARGHHDPSTFADIINQMGKMYSKVNKYPFTIVERNNHGHAVLLKLREVHRYPNLWLDSDEKPGHRTTSLSRPLLMDLFIDAVAYNAVNIKFRDILSECLTLVDNDGKIEAESGKHDDAVFACALAIRVASDIKHKVGLYRDLDKRIMT